MIAENVKNSYTEYLKAEASEEGVVAWSRENAGAAALVTWALRLAYPVEE